MGKKLHQGLPQATQTGICRAGSGRVLTYLLGLVALALAVGGSPGCKPAGNGPPLAGGVESPTRPAVPLAWRAEGFAGQITAVRLADAGLQIDLLLPGKAVVPTAPVHFGLCLPDPVTAKLKIRRYAIGKQVVLQLDAKDRLTTGTAVRTIDARQAMTLQRKGIARHWAISHLILNREFWRPFQDLHGRFEGDLTVTVELTWPAPKVAPAPVTIEPANVLYRTVAQVVADPEGLGRWAVAKPALKNGLMAQPDEPRPLAPKATAWARVTIEKDGIYRLGVKELAQAGLPATAAALAQVRLFAKGQALPLYRDLAGKGEAGAVYFYGWPSKSPYAKEQVYWLALAGDLPALELPAAEAALSSGTARPLTRLHRRTVLRRKNTLKIKQDNFLNIEEMQWLDAPLSGTQPIALPLGLDHPAPLTEQPRLEATLKFFQPGPPEKLSGLHASLRQGTQRLAELTFMKNDKLEKKVMLPATLFAGGETTLTLQADGPADKSAAKASGDEAELWLETAEIAYQALPSLHGGRLTLDKDAVATAGLYRIELPEAAAPAPRRLLALAVQPGERRVARLDLKGGALTFGLRNGWQAEVYDLALAAAPRLAPVQWQDEALSEAGGVDYLIITHAMFKDALKPLLELNQQRGLKTKVVDVERLYDLFSGGMLSPEAIRAYLGYTVQHWRAGSPQYVLLLGDCSSDYLNQTRSGVTNLVPSYTRTYGSDKWASDYWFAVVCGDDDLPDFVLGRMSVNTLEAAKVVIAKTVHYATDRSLGPWRARLAYVADNLEQFEATAETVRTQFTPDAFDGRRIYLNHLALEDNWYIPKSHIERVWAEERSWMKVSGATTSRIKETFNSGVAMLDYFGHGSPNIWADERIWFGGGSPNRDSQYLKSSHYAFVTNYTCNAGAIDYPMPRWNVCISEDLMQTPGGGAVGLFVPSGPGTTPTHEKLARYWRLGLFEDNVRQIGELSVLARLRYGLEDLPEDMMYMFILLGDPALNLQLTQRWQSLKLEPKLTRPGQSRALARLENVKPARGQAQAWLENEAGETIWQGSPFDYTGGRIEAPVEIPATVGSPARLHVLLYGWNSEAGSDFVAGGDLRLEEPRIALGEARATRSDAQQVHFQVTVEKKNALDSGEMKLRVTRVGAAEPLAEQAVHLAAQETKKTIELTATLAAQGVAGSAELAGPVCFEAALALADLPDNAEQAQTLRQRFVLLPEPGWVGFVPELSHRQSSGKTQGDRTLAYVLSGTRPTTATYLLRRRTASGDALGTQTVTLAPGLGSLYSASVICPPGASKKGSSDDQDRLELLETKRHSPPQTRVISQMSLKGLTRLEPRLRIKPGSISHRPEKPTDGETVWVSFTVENIGTAPAPGCQPTLLDKAPPENGQKLPVQTGLAAQRMPELGPGRSCPVTLRWDPIRNGGVQTIWVDANPAGGRTEQALKEQVSSYRLYIKSKSKLVRTRAPWASGQAEETLAGRFNLHCEIENQGETDARGIEVTFFRNEQKDEKDQLGMVPLAVLPAKGKAEAILKNCKVDQRKDRPTVEIRLKGSAQRVGD